MVTWSDLVTWPENFRKGAKWSMKRHGRKRRPCAKIFSRYLRKTRQRDQNAPRSSHQSEGYRHWSNLHLMKFSSRSHNSLSQDAVTNCFWGRVTWPGLVTYLRWLQTYFLWMLRKVRIKMHAKNWVGSPAHHFSDINEKNEEGRQDDPHGVRVNMLKNVTFNAELY